MRHQSVSRLSLSHPRPICSHVLVPPWLTIIFATFLPPYVQRVGHLGLSLADIHRIAEDLVNDGLIYSTTDENTYKPTSEWRCGDTLCNTAPQPCLGICFPPQESRFIPSPVIPFSCNRPPIHSRTAG